MNKNDFEKSLACPKCRSSLYKQLQKGECIKCHFKFGKTEGIWNLISSKNSKTLTSQKGYDLGFREEFGGPTDGSYDILASIAKGNKTVDIACGVGLIEKLASETVGVDFSLTALRKARRNGAKYLVQADAHALPFIDNSFDVAISSGNLEHFAAPQKAINEMARISKIQVLIVHKTLPIPFYHFIFNLFTQTFKIKHQPIEKPISNNKLASMLKKAKLKIIYKGVWTLPVNYGRVINFLPEFKNVPSCSFIISIKIT